MRLGREVLLAALVVLCACQLPRAERDRDERPAKVEARVGDDERGIKPPKSKKAPAKKKPSAPPRAKSVEAPKAKPIPVAPPPPAAPTHVLCCDGTRSPTCECGRASFQGCCSKHGGICEKC